MSIVQRPNTSFYEIISFYIHIGGSEDKSIVLWDFCKPFSDERSTAK